jgi:hypothetical protein
MLIRIFSLVFIVFFFYSCQKEISYIVKEDSKKELIEKGQKAVAIAFTSLSTQLKDEIANSGFDGAISFCKVEAPKILYDASTKAMANIHRVTDKPRNPKSLANEKEMEIINNYISLQKTNSKMEATLIADKSKVTFYSPIKILPLCMNCHGTVNKEVSESTKEILNQLYPEDKALNYNIDDLRGLWKIEFSSAEEHIEQVKD